MEHFKSNKENIYATLDFTDPDSIVGYARNLVGMTFQEVLDLGIAPEGVDHDYSSNQYKGGVGNLIEERYFGYRANSDERPDFAEVGIELKTTCYDVKRNGELSAGERLVLTMIPFDREVEDDFYSSHLWAKSKDILLVYYERLGRGKTQEYNRYDQTIHYVTLFTPPETDLKIIRDDYDKIIGLIEAGKADELSESLTTYLGACTKGATEATMWVNQFYPPHTKAKKRAFCFKRQYMDYVLHHYVIGQADEAESIVKDADTLKDMTFDDYVVDTVGRYAGRTDREICAMLGLPYTGNKAQWTQISYAMLGIRGKHAEEFEKGNISVRTVRIEENGSIRESISLDTFRFKDLAKEEWEDSELHDYLDETRFLFVAFQKRGDESVLLGCTFWSMPQTDLEGPVRECWERTKKTIEEGVTFKAETDRNGNVSYSNDLPNKSDGLIAHVRPHTAHAAYRFKDGTVIGNPGHDADELPDRQWMTRQSFWLNSDYIYTVIEDSGL